MERKALIKKLREEIKIEEKNNELRKQKNAEWFLLCKDGATHYGSVRLEDHRNKWKDVPYVKSYPMTGINPAPYGGRELSYISALHCVLAHLRGKQHLYSVRIAGTTTPASSSHRWYNPDGVMVVARVTPEMYKAFVDDILAKLLKMWPPVIKPIDKQSRALSVFCKTLEEKGLSFFKDLKEYK